MKEKEEKFETNETKENAEKKKKYLFELQKFLDLKDNMENEKLKKMIIYQMLECNKSLVNLLQKKL